MPQLTILSSFLNHRYAITKTPSYHLVFNKGGVVCNFFKPLQIPFPIITFALCAYPMLS